MVNWIEKRVDTHKCTHWYYLQLTTISSKIKLRTGDEKTILMKVKMLTYIYTRIHILQLYDQNEQLKNSTSYYTALALVLTWRAGVARKDIIWEYCWWITLLVDSKFPEINPVYDVKDGEYRRKENSACDVQEGSID